MSVVTEEPAEAGRGEAASMSRRAMALKLRDVRERLTSNGLRPAFDQELTRQFAHARLTAAPAVLMLVLAIAAATSLWTTGLVITVWLLCMTMAQATMVLIARRFLKASPDAKRMRSWRLRFALGELAAALCWAALGLHLSHIDNEAARVFVLFLTMLVVAVSTMLSATSPAVMYVGALPISVAVVAASLAAGNVTGTAIAL